MQGLAIGLPTAFQARIWPAFQLEELHQSPPVAQRLARNDVFAGSEFPVHVGCRLIAHVMWPAALFYAHGANRLMAPLSKRERETRERKRDIYIYIYVYVYVYMCFL